jgi:hypothetical protein
LWRGRSPPRGEARPHGRPRHFRVASAQIDKGTHGEDAQDDHLQPNGSPREARVSPVHTLLEVLSGQHRCTSLKDRLGSAGADGSGVEVRDGAGIEARDLATILESLFTTQPDGRGTGLGSPIAQGIVVKHGGSVRVGRMLGAGRSRSGCRDRPRPRQTVPRPWTGRASGRASRARGSRSATRRSSHGNGRRPERTR